MWTKGKAARVLVPNGVSLQKAMRTVEAIVEFGGAGVMDGWREGMTTEAGEIRRGQC